MLYSEGFGVLRVAGSGSATIPATDLIAGKKGRLLAIECKSSKATIKRYLKNEQVKELKELSKRMGAEAWFGLRYNNEEWLFLEPKHLDKSKNGTYCVDLKLAKKKGLKFGELIGKFKQKKL
jgi:Holliday junction resolvase